MSTQKNNARVPGDWLLHMAPSRNSLAVKTALSGQSLKCGQICAVNSDGKCLAITATGNETHTYTLTGTPTAGTFTVTLWHPDGYWVTTGPIDFDESQANVIIALNQALIQANSGAVTSVVTGAGVAITAFTVVHSGTGYASKLFPLGQLDWSNLTGVTACATTRSTAAGVTRNEVQTITLDAAVTAGDYNLTIYAPDGVPLSVSVAWNTNWATTMADINTAITAAATAWYGGASVGAVMTGTATAQVLTFSGNGFAGEEVALSVMDPGGATGPVAASIVRTTSGGVAGNRVGNVAEVIAYEDIDASLADTSGLFVVRDAVVDADQLLYGGGDYDGCVEALATQRIYGRTQSGYWAPPV